MGIGYIALSGFGAKCWLGDGWMEWSGYPLDCYDYWAPAVLITAIARKWKMEIDFFKFAPLYPSSKSSSRLRSSMILQNSWNLFQPWDFEWVYQILHNFAKAHKKENTNDTISEKLPNLVQKSGDSAKSFWKLENVQRCKNLWMSQTSVSVLNDLLMCWKWKGHKGGFQILFGRFFCQRGIPSPPPLCVHFFA